MALEEHVAEVEDEDVSGSSVVLQPFSVQLVPHERDRPPRSLVPRFTVPAHEPTVVLLDALVVEGICNYPLPTEVIRVMGFVLGVAENFDTVVAVFRGEFEGKTHPFDVGIERAGRETEERSDTHARCYNTTASALGTAASSSRLVPPAAFV